MIPVLFERDATTFRDNGIGRLSDAITCTVEEVQNGLYELEMTYPITGIHYEDITEDRLIVAEPYENGNWQAFHIYRISRPINGVVTVKAEHISYLLNKIVVMPYSATSCASALSSIPTHTANNCPFTFTTDKDVQGNFDVTYPRPVRGMLGGEEGSILDIYGKGEYLFDNFDVHLYVNRGVDNGVTIRYGKNLTDLVRSSTLEYVYTGIVPYWTNNDVTITLPEKVVYSEHRDAFAYDIIKAVDLSDHWENAPTEEQLRNFAQYYVSHNEGWKISENIKVSFVPLWQTEEYKDIANMERVHMGDTVHVIYEALGVTASSKVVRTVYNVLTERYIEIELGTKRNSLGQVLSEDIVPRVKQESTSFMQKAIAVATEWLTNADSHVYLVRDANDNIRELLFLDGTEDPATAQNVMRINSSGLGFSSNGVDGPYTNAFVFGGDYGGMLVADLITTGTLNANLIKAGVLEDAEHKNSINMETGAIKLNISASEIGGVEQSDFDSYTGNLETRLTAWNGQLRSEINSTREDLQNHYFVPKDAIGASTGWHNSSALNNYITFETLGEGSYRLTIDGTDITSTSYYVRYPISFNGIGNVTFSYAFEVEGITTLARQFFVYVGFTADKDGLFYLTNNQIEITDGEPIVYVGSSTTKVVPDENGIYTNTLSKSYISRTGTQESVYIRAIPGAVLKITFFTAYTSASQYAEYESSLIDQRLGNIELSVSQLEQTSKANYIPDTWTSPTLDDWYYDSVETYPIEGTTYNNIPCVDFDGKNVSTDKWNNYYDAYRITLSEIGTYSYKFTIVTDTAVTPPNSTTDVARFAISVANPDTATQSTYPEIWLWTHVRLKEQPAGTAVEYEGTIRIPDTITWNGVTGATQIRTWSKDTNFGVANLQIYFIPQATLHIYDFSLYGSATAYAKAVISIASDMIEQEVSRATSAEGELSSRITTNANGIATKVEKNGIISAINQSAESVTINANRINLAGQVTLNSLDSSLKDQIVIPDTRSANNNPQWYMTNYPQRTIREFKQCNSIGLGTDYGTFCVLETYVPWGDSSGGYPTQVAYCNKVLNNLQVTFTRTGTSNTAWSAWKSTDVMVGGWAYSSNQTYINGAMLFTGTVVADKIAAGAITVGKIADGAVNSAKLADSSVTSAKIPSSAITTVKIADGAISAGKIAANAVTAAKIAANAVTADKINAGAVTAAKIAAGAITADKIAANAINGKTITGATIQTAASGTRILMDTSSSIKGYNGSTLVNILNMSQSNASVIQMTIDAKNQLNIRTPKVAVTTSSYGTGGGTATVTRTGDTDYVSYVSKNYNGANEGNISMWNDGGSWSVYCTLPVFLDVRYSRFHTIHGMQTTNQTTNTNKI